MGVYIWLCKYSDVCAICMSLFFSLLEMTAGLFSNALEESKGFVIKINDAASNSCTEKWRVLYYWFNCAVSFFLVYLGVL